MTRTLPILLLVSALGACWDPKDYRPDPPASEGEGEGAEGEGEGVTPPGPQPDDVVGTAWYEKHVEPDPFVQPDCGSAHRQMDVCEEWLVEEKRKAGDRWRVGACHVVELPTNKAVPTTWGCRLVGQYNALVETDEDQTPDQEWTFERMFEGRDCDDAEDAKGPCSTWLGLIREDLGEAITSATCTIEPFSPARGANYCRLWGRIVYTGFPQQP